MRRWRTPRMRGWPLGSAAAILPASRDILAHLVILILLAMAISLAGWVLHRRLTRRHDESRSPSGLTLEQLRLFRREGQINDEEYDRLRSQVIRQHGESPGSDMAPKLDDERPGADENSQKDSTRAPESDSDNPPGSSGSPQPS